MPAQGITYNTIMSLVAGAVPLLLLVFARAAGSARRRTLEGWAWTFVALGLVLFGSGAAMTLTWPLKNIPDEVANHCCAVDNIAFGEPAMFFGALLIGAGIALARAEARAERHGEEVDLVALARPFLYAAAFGGLVLFMLVAAAAQYGMWRPPTEEPIAGAFAGTWLETAYLGGTYAVTGLAALLSPFALTSRVVARLTGLLLLVSGAGFLYLTLATYYSHLAFIS